MANVTPFYGSEKGGCNGQDKVEERNPKLFRRPQIMGKTREEEFTYLASVFEPIVYTSRRQRSMKQMTFGGLVPHQLQRIETNNQADIQTLDSSVLQYQVTDLPISQQIHGTQVRRRLNGLSHLQIFLIIWIFLVSVRR